jgi:hypothetical protein
LRNVESVKVLWVESVGNDFKEFFVVVERFDQFERFLVLKVFRHFDVLPMLPSALSTVAFVAEDESLFDELDDRLKVFHLVQKSPTVLIANKGQVIVEPKLFAKK